VRVAERPPSENDETKTTCVKQEGVLAMKPYFPGALCACVLCFSGALQASRIDAGLAVRADVLAVHHAMSSLPNPVTVRVPALSPEQSPSSAALIADLGVPIDLGTLRTAESDGC
jgi:hypothetical protein